MRELTGGELVEVAGGGKCECGSSKKSKKGSKKGSETKPKKTKKGSKKGSNCGGYRW